MSEPLPDGERRRAADVRLRGATVLGIGSMIGAGIFALLGEAGGPGRPAHPPTLSQSLTRA